jgi:hypothetical protein
VENLRRLNAAEKKRSGSGKDKNRNSSADRERKKNAKRASSTSGLPRQESEERLDKRLAALQSDVQDFRGKEPGFVANFLSTPEWAAVIGRGKRLASRRPKRRKSQASRQREQWASKGEDLCQALGCSLVELLRWPGMPEFQCYHSPGAHSWKDFLARIMTEANAKSSRQQSSRKFRKADECLPESAKANGCIRLSTIWGRGWSKGQVEAILGEADARTRNPHYRKAAPMRLYSTARVLQAEKEGRVLLRPRITKITPVS